VCKKIVADLLGFSRQTQSAKREMCFNNSVMEAVSLVRHTLELDKVEIVTQLDDRYPIIYGDPEKLKQVWINLLTNARDAMVGQGGTILIRTRLDTPGGIVSLWVADSGSGIAEDALKNIFDPFYSTKAVDKGTGLGLSVSFGIIEDHGGDIRAESPVPEDFGFPSSKMGAEGGGTVFEVNLPLDHQADGGEPEKE
jgi:signal transduction histidine kinase